MFKKTMIVAVGILLMAVALAAPVGATALAPNPGLDIQGQGLSIAEAGVGLEGVGGTTDTRNISITIGGPVQKAFLYWAGRERAGCPQGACFDNLGAQPFGDQQLIFDGNAITGTIVGVEDDDQSNIGYRADVTSIVGAKGTGTYSIMDGNVDNNLDVLNGAGLLVLYTDPGDSNSYRVIVFEGLDFAFGFQGDTTPFAANLVTDPVTFNYAASGSSRSAQLVVFAGDASADRPDRIDISDNDSQTGQLNGSDGAEWDTDSFGIDIPAAVGSTTVQLFSAPANQFPDSLLWILGALRIPLPSGFQGCTPGYWKNHLSSWTPSGFTPTQTVESVFDAPGFPTLGAATLQQALGFGGGPGTQGGAQILLRAGAAALLNAAHSSVNYTQSTSQLVTNVNGALASNDRDMMLNLASQLDTFNNLGCPLS